MTPLTWEECGCTLKQLQAAAHVVHDKLNQVSCSASKRELRVLLRKILSCLQEFRQAIDTVFLLNDHEVTHQQKLCCFIEEKLDHIAELLAATQNCARSKIPAITSIQQECFREIQDELAAVAQINDILASHDLPYVDNANKEHLKALVTRLRQQEQQLAFHRGLLKAQQELSGSDSDYSAENFAYGSTPFPTWLNLFTQKSVLDAIVREPKQAMLTVFGSSSGSLVFFAALALDLRSTGVEILPFLHELAEQTRKDLQISKNKCRFKCADMLTVSVQETSILLLTSQCWDAALYQQVQHKLEAELQPGALVIDYKNALQSSPHFHLLHQLPHQRVSWNNSQSFFIFERSEQ
ncbi:hypothetical protein JG687_00002668 [Phytophthora cactorum]|uniref:S-adenosyl-L-methionine-dependent methyltransferase n=1 Tax=Phytophthora cactorum TaxID=29920 RepID=A0A329SSM0_9STRA|nr:hypothetical protein Pcac1_g3948 [Phytophthora cactorum]KAG2825644.1 hypothetical protein PC112_g9627 [Phytophthora cactorum]KAG2834851.1 hypothetical protein PC111_g5666 [Phytophthora cactorum]KAG2858308.1 hypothetical protein PC113_g9924 [Phytophthora cactorum]KAG2915403.1 hypothetical protein PC114_g7869 [Phytophthora cactorum]